MATSAVSTILSMLAAPDSKLLLRRSNASTRPSPPATDIWAATLRMTAAISSPDVVILREMYSRLSISVRWSMRRWSVVSVLATELVPLRIETQRFRS